MATDYKALGKRISNARKQAGITQEALGEQLNMTRKHISVIESLLRRSFRRILKCAFLSSETNNFHSSGRIGRSSNRQLL